ncbi:MAG: amino acid ABC transporter substrate-binding protein [Alphaproteobacteria bacterium]|nr:MAG: amino acid ABC transporter substrate-binding protein [Alphaproteobacteria bacterium]
MFKKATLLAAAVVGAGIWTVPVPAEAGAVLDAIRQRGSIRCGIQTGTPGFGFPDSAGVWQGFNVEVCRAVSVMLFNDPSKVQFVPVTSQQRFPALQAGEVDLLSNNSTNTLTRDTQLGFNFGPTVFYDGQGLMVPRRLGVSKATELNGATVCVQPGTTTELNLSDFFRQNRMTFNAVVIDNQAELRNAFFAGRCDVYTNDASALAADRTVAQNPNDYVILPERISKEPLAPVVRHGDEQWFDIVKWAVYALIEGEELGITSQNVDTFLTSNNPIVRRFLGVEPGMGQALGVDQRYAYNILKTVGNYGQIFDKWLGAGSPIRLERGLNELWTKGGLQYAPPAR